MLLIIQLLLELKLTPLQCTHYMPSTFYIPLLVPQLTQNLGEPPHALSHFLQHCTHMPMPYHSAILDTNPQCTHPPTHTHEHKSNTLSPHHFKVPESIPIHCLHFQFTYTLFHLMNYPQCTLTHLQIAPNFVTHQSSIYNPINSMEPQPL